MGLIRHNQPTEPFWVEIKWATYFGQLDRGTHISGYEFATESELRAFLFGLDEARGWGDHRIITASSEAAFVKKFAYYQEETIK